jgi:hypothetical protein
MWNPRIWGLGSKTSVLESLRKCNFYFFFAGNKFSTGGINFPHGPEYEHTEWLLT